MSPKEVDVATSEMHRVQPAVVTSGNLLERIGTPDYSGWMQKKGETRGWKQRFFVLKGVHLYYLKSENVRVPRWPGRDGADSVPSRRSKKLRALSTLTATASSPTPTSTSGSLASRSFIASTERTTLARQSRSRCGRG